MYWRNRIPAFTQEQLFSKTISPSIRIFESGKVTFSSPFHEDEDLTTGDIFPDVIIIQADVKPLFWEKDDVFIKASSQATPYMLYHEKASLVDKALKSVDLIFHEFVHESGMSQQWIKEVEKPSHLYRKEFEVLEAGIHVWDEKRSPREGIPEQSLWSYGGTYTADFDVCQVAQMKFFPHFIDNKTSIRTFKSKKSLSILEYIQNGEIILFKEISEKKIYYQSFFMKSCTHKKVHIHFKKCITTP